MAHVSVAARVKTDMQISRIRLSPASSSLRARQVGPTARQGKEAEGLIEILVRMAVLLSARLSAASHQPSLQTPLNIPAHQLVGRKNRPLVEMLGPAAERRYDLLVLGFRYAYVASSRRGPAGAGAGIAFRDALIV